MSVDKEGQLMLWPSCHVMSCHAIPSPSHLMPQLISCHKPSRATGHLVSFVSIQSLD